MKKLSTSYTLARQRRELYYDLRRGGSSPNEASIELGIDDFLTRQRYERWWQTQPEAVPLPLTVHDHHDYTLPGVHSRRNQVPGRDRV
jgi:hypothetical protein